MSSELLNPPNVKVLFVAMPEAIHTARWIGQLSDTGWDLQLFPSRDCAPVKELPSGLKVHSLLPARWSGRRPDLVNTSLINWPYQRGRERVRRVCTRLKPGLASSAGQLAQVINQQRPQIVHTMEMQLAGYMMADAFPFIAQRDSFKWIYSCWGNDITFYGEDPVHRSRIAKVLQNVDYYTADCPRDMELIGQFDPRGEALPVFPTGGGYDVDRLNGLRTADPVSRRKVIALKGYHDKQWTGRAIHALRAIERCADVLAGFEIAIYRPNDCVRHVAEYLARFTDLRIRILPKWIDNEEVLRLLGESRISICTNRGDGTPNAMLESMIMGAFPIQSSTADTSQWIQDGRNGLLVEYDDIDSISSAIRRAVADDELVDHAAVVSQKLVSSRLRYTQIQSDVIDVYQAILEGGAIPGLAESGSLVASEQ